MTRELLNRVKMIEQSPVVIKAIEYQRKVGQWEEIVSYFMPDMKQQLAIWEYQHSPDSRAVMADDFMEFEISVIHRLELRHPIAIEECWEREVAEPIRFEVYKELMLRWYGINRTPEEEAEAMRISKQLNDDFNNGVPREQSEAALLYKEWIEQNPRRNYRYEVLHAFKPEGWEWQL